MIYILKLYSKGNCIGYLRGLSEQNNRYYKTLNLNNAKHYESFDLAAAESDKLVAITGGNVVSSIERLA